VTAIRPHFLMYALWKTQGVTIRPWRADVRFGASATVTLSTSASRHQPWEGHLLFDRPRHKLLMHLRSTTLASTSSPSGSPFQPDARYQVKLGSASRRPEPVLARRRHPVKLNARNLFVEVSTL